MKLRKLNEQGVKRFREFLEETRAGGSRVKNAPMILLELPLTSEEIIGAPELKPFTHAVSSFELAGYLHGQFSKLDAAVIEGTNGYGDPGFWAAVSLFYFDLLSSGYREDSNRILADNCYIPELGTTFAGVRYFRHRIAGAYRVFRLHGELSEPLLLSNAGTQSALYVEITDSVFYTETRCVVEAVNLLYFDKRNRRLKRDWNAKDKPGSLPRLLAVVDQFDLTYDLLGINGETLLAQLPEEFEDWHSQNRVNSN